MPRKRGRPRKATENERVEARSPFLENLEEIQNAFKVFRMLLTVLANASAQNTAIDAATHFVQQFKTPEGRAVINRVIRLYDTAVAWMEHTVMGSVGYFGLLANDCESLEKEGEALAKVFGESMPSELRQRCLTLGEMINELDI